MKKMLQFLILGTLCLTYAQQDNSTFQLNGIEEKTNTKSIYNNTFKEYNLYAINTHEIINYFRLENKTTRLNLKLGNNLNFPIILNRHNLRSSNYVLQQNTENEGIIVHPKSEIFTFRGYHDKSDQKVVLTIAENFISGFIVSGDKTLYIEPARNFNKAANKNSFIVYAINSVISKESNAICHQGEKLPEGKSFRVNKKASKSLVTNCSEMGIAFDQSFKTLMGGTSQAEAELTARLNLVSNFFVEKFNIEYKIVSIYECAANEFTPDSNTESCQEGNGTCQNGTVLKEFSRWGNTGGFGGVARDVSTFWTDRNLVDGFNTGNIGYSFFEGVCGEQGYNIVEDFFTTGINGHVSIWIHELGHTWNAYHVQDNAQNMMSPNIYGNSTSNPTNRNVTNSTLTSITNFRNTLGFCLDQGCEASLAPVCSFIADNDSGCGGSLTVNFSDTSENTPNTWEWDFGDGNSSNEKNPTHTFSGGEFTVSLLVANDIGDSNVVTQTITVSNGEQYPLVNVGPVDNNEINGGGFYNTGRYLIFDANEDFVLNSVKVYAGAAGSRTFSVRNSNGTTLESISEFLVAGEQRVTLDWNIESGTNYQLYAPGNSDLYRNNVSGGAGFPYTDPSGLTTIKCQDFDQNNCDDYYYFFYDWEVRQPGCDESSLSVTDNNKFENIFISPNPFNEVLNIKIFDEQDYNFKIYNALGALVYDNGEITNNNTQIDLRSLSSGLYFIKLNKESSNDQMTIKILKY